MTILAIGEITIANIDDVNISTDQPIDPVPDQLWLDTSTVPNILKRWAWIEDEEGWGWINASPTSPEDIGAETPDGAQEKADDAVAAASTLLQSMADGTYTGGTFIDGKSIISPTVVGLQGTFGELMAGDPFGARLELGESAGEPFLEAYDSENDLRVKLLQDRLQFFTNDVCGGEIYAQTLERDSADYHHLNVFANDYLSLFAGFQLNINSNHEISIVAVDEGEPYKPAAIMLQSFEGLFSSIEIMADSTHINGDLYLRGNPLFNFAYADDASARTTTSQEYTGDYNLLLDIYVTAGEYYMVQLDGAFWVTNGGTRVEAYIDVVSGATKVGGDSYIFSSSTAAPGYSGSVTSIFRATTTGQITFYMRWRVRGELGIGNCRYRSMKAWRIG